MAIRSDVKAAARPESCQPPPRKLILQGMGLFLDLSGVIGTSKEAVLSALKAYAEERGGSLAPATGTMAEGEALVLAGTSGRWSILYPGDFTEAEAASEYLSERLEGPVFHFHIHDGDLWMFQLFQQGRKVDQFNTIPDYWGEVSDFERESWKGKAGVVAALTGRSPDEISPYLQPWDLDDDDPGKAHPEDRYTAQDCWQLCDFLQRIGLPFPADDEGRPRGECYTFRIGEA